MYMLECLSLLVHTYMECAALALRVAEYHRNILWWSLSLYWLRRNRVMVDVVLSVFDTNIY